MARPDGLRDVAPARRPLSPLRVAGIAIMEHLPIQPKTIVAVEVEHLRKCFGNFCAVNDLNFSVAYGEVFGLLGPNGAGKSTLIRVLTTLLPPTSGVARILGFDVARYADQVRKCIGVIPQAMTSDLDLSAMENMQIFAKLYSVPRDRRIKVANELLEAVDLLPGRTNR